MDNVQTYNQIVIVSAAVEDLELHLDHGDDAEVDEGEPGPADDVAGAGAEAETDPLGLASNTLEGASGGDKKADSEEKPEETQPEN